MKTSNDRPKGVLVIGTAAVVACLIGLLLVRGLVLGLYGVDIFSSEGVDNPVCAVAALPAGLGLVWLLRRQNFSGAPYTAKEHGALRLQAALLAACVVLGCLLLVTQQPFIIPLLAILIAWIGIVVIRSRVSLVAFRYGSFYPPSNNEPSAVFVGLLEIAAAIGLLYAFFVRYLEI